MQKVLAKSNPEKELHEHTLEVIKFAEREIENLKSLGLNISPDVEKAIKICCFAHDLGKVSKTFQDSLSGDKRYIPHNLLSLIFLKSIFDVLDFSEDLKNKIIYSIGFHHKNFLELNEFINGSRRTGANSLEDEIIDIEENRLSLLKPMQKLFKICFGCEINFSVDYNIIDKHKEIILNLEPFDNDVILIKGILHRADHIASSGIDEIPKIYLKSEAYNNLKEYITLKRFQEEIANKKDSLLLIAPTGSGKTEAALCWAGTKKGKIIFTLPTRASVNAAFNKLKKYYGDDVGILHGEAGRFIYSTLKKEHKETEAIEESFHEINLSKNLLKPVLVTTIDQIFSFALRVHQYEKILMGLYGSNVILDEIDSYSPYTIEILKQSLKIAKNFEIIPLLMSATIPEFLIKEFINEGIVVEQYKPSWDELEIKNDAKHEISMINSDITDCAKIIRNLSKEEQNSVLIVCNTIKKAILVYEKLKEFSPKLYHSLFTFNDRESKELEIGKSDKEGRNIGIWITTQVVEVSLDLDFDALITEIAPINVLIQRMGRCYRKRKGAGKVFICSKSLNENGKPEFYPYGEFAIEESLKSLKEIKGIVELEDKFNILNNYFENYWKNRKVEEDKEKARNIIGNFLNSDLTLLETISKHEVSRFLRDTGISITAIPISKLKDEELDKLKGKYKWKDSYEKLSFLYEIYGRTISMPLHVLLKFRSLFEETKQGLFLTYLQYNSDIGLSLKNLHSII
ncbi:CRISPR-associated helicase Cas3' [Thermodesulfovibrio yellowstonii]|uniref:CRISPR-associated helicase Cas3' n=1 Tax=Thermodesulfovibrio yellowstonii TaxID=28262 RepID=UPI003C797A24